MNSAVRDAALESSGMVQSVGFRGHPMVRSLHSTTIEITTEEHLTARGDCILGVGAEHGCSGIREEVKLALRREGSSVKLKLVVDEEEFAFEANGNPRLVLSHPHDIVIRKSSFLSDRTLAVGASASAKDVPRSIVKRLRSPDARGRLEIEVT